MKNLKELQSARALRSAVNVDIPVSGKPRRRNGYQSIQSGSGHSLWAAEDWSFALMVYENSLTRFELVDGFESLTPLMQVVSSNRWRYCEMNNSIYASNGLTTARIDRLGALQSWGVDSPGGQPALSATTGWGLDAGRYQVAITAVAPSGEESGTGRAAVVAVSADGGITLSTIPQTAPDHAINIYCSPPNGEALYHVARIPYGITSFTIDRSHIAQMGKLLDTQFCDKIPASSFLCSYRGRIYFAIGDTLYYTLALRYGQFRIHQTYFRFPHRITGVAAVDDGIYVGTQRGAYFLGGNDPKDMQQLPVDAFGVVENTLQDTRGVTFGLKLPPNEKAAVWWSNNGVLMRGGASGVITPITKGRLALPKFSSGSLLLREQDQLQQLISVFRGGDNGSPLAARDAITLKVIRNGVAV
ncbi:MAG: hypothetical protein V4607_02045 [Pseudomonadota bacterium]